MKIKKAIIPAAGLGTRFLPATKSIPKEMLPILDKPTIQYVVEEAFSSGIEEILIILSREKNSIENHFDISYELEDNLLKKEKYDFLKSIKFVSRYKNIYFIRQKYPQGLGNAISCGKSFVGKESFAVLLGDDLFYNKKDTCLKQLINQFEIVKSNIFAVLEVPIEQVNKYGIITGKKIKNNLYKINDLIEKPKITEAKSNLAIMGRYIFTSTIFDMINITSPDKNNEIQLTDAMKKLLNLESLFGYIFKGKRYDTGYLLGYLNAILDFGLNRKDINIELLKLLKEKIKTNN